MSCGVCGVTPCLYCGKLMPAKGTVCPHCNKEVLKKVCIHCGQSYSGFTGDPPVCPNCGEELPKEFL